MGRKGAIDQAKNNKTDINGFYNPSLPAKKFILGLNRPVSIRISH